MRWLFHSKLVAVLGVGLLLPLAACPPVDPPVDGGNPPKDGGGPPPDGGNPPPDGPAPDGGGVCGDGYKDPGEECDDGNQLQTDGCLNDCTYNVCGDTYVNAGVEECDDGNIANGDGCNAQCQSEIIDVTYVTVRGEVRDRKYADPRPQAGASILLSGVQCNGATCQAGPTDETGLYGIPNVPVQSAFYMHVTYPETFGPNNQPVPTGFATRIPAASKDQAEETVNAYVVKYNWLSQVAYECGVYDDITNVYDANNYPTAALGNPEWLRYSAVVGQLKEQATGNGVSGVDKARLEVQLGGEVNDVTTRGNPSYFCWLERYQAAPGEPYYFRGTTAQTSNESGYFAIFKVRNDTNATGVGTQYVRVKYDAALPNFAEVSVPVQAGNVSLVTLYTQDVVPPPPLDLVDFDTDIYPLFTTFGCTACHYAGGPGAVYADPVNQQYPADFTAGEDQVYAYLTAPGTTCGAPQDPNNPRDPLPAPYRVCVDYPKRAKLATKPLYEEPANHPNASFLNDNDPNLILLETWMEQGAPRYAVPPVVPPLEYSLEGVMRVSYETGCTSCHGYNTGYSGGLALDGCIQALVDDGTYANAGVETDPALNPDYKQSCVYYHLKNQGVADDPYGYGYRVDPANPGQSMLLYNPYCGPGYCANDPDYPEVHPVRVFPTTEDARYQAIYSWIAAGANNNKDADLGQ